MLCLNPSLLLFCYRILKTSTLSTVHKSLSPSCFSEVIYLIVYKSEGFNFLSPF